MRKKEKRKEKEISQAVGKGMNERRASEQNRRGGSDDFEYRTCHSNTLDFNVFLLRLLNSHLWPLILSLSLLSLSLSSALSRVIQWTTNRWSIRATDNYEETDISQRLRRHISSHISSRENSNVILLHHYHSKIWSIISNTKIRKIIFTSVYTCITYVWNSFSSR